MGKLARPRPDCVYWTKYWLNTRILSSIMPWKYIGFTVNSCYNMAKRLLL